MFCSVCLHSSDLILLRFADMNTNKVMAWRTPLALQIVFLLTILSAL